MSSLGLARFFALSSASTRRSSRRRSLPSRASLSRPLGEHSRERRRQCRERGRAAACAIVGERERRGARDTYASVCVHRTAVYLPVCVFRVKREASARAVSPRVRVCERDRVRAVPTRRRVGATSVRRDGCGGGGVSLETLDGSRVRRCAVHGVVRPDVRATDRPTG